MITQHKSTSFIRHAITASFTLCLFLLIYGCASIETLAPPVDPLLLETARPLGYQQQELQRGRHIYITKCANCHSPEPVNRYTKEQWEKTIPDMAERTSLNQQEINDLRSYINSVLASQ